MAIGDYQMRAAKDWRGLTVFQDEGRRITLVMRTRTPTPLRPAGACVAPLGGGDTHILSRRAGFQFMSSNYDLIRQAIVNKQQVIATYNGYERQMCPHVIGRKAGRQQALFFQFAGGSSSGLPRGGEWRCIPISGLTNVSLQDGDWHSGASHSRPQTCVDSIDVEVDH